MFCSTEIITASSCYIDDFEKIATVLAFAFIYGLVIGGILLFIKSNN